MLVVSDCRTDTQWRIIVRDLATVTVSAGSRWMGTRVLFPIDIGMYLSILQTSRFIYRFFISVKDLKFVAC
jgi:hypothetical protein